MTSPEPTILAELARFDRDAHALVQLAAPPVRAGLASLYGFNLEVAKIREVVRDGLTGQFRLQWWRDTIDELFADAAPRRHPVAASLAQTIRNHGLPRAPFDRMLEARGFDLEDRAPSTRAALEEYAEASGAPLFTLAAHLADRSRPPPPAVEHAAAAAGKARVIAGLLVAVPFYARQRRIMIPDDVAHAHGLRVETLLDRLKPVDGLVASVASLAAIAQTELDEARRCAAALPRSYRPAFLPLVLVRDHLQALRRGGYDPFDPRVKTAQRFRYAKLAVAAFLNRV